MQLLKVFLLFYLLTGAVAAQQRLILAGPDDHPTGDFIKSVLTEAYGQLGIDIEFMPLPPMRSLAMSNDGLVDGEIFRSPRMESRFPDLVRVPVLLAYGETAAFVIDPNIKIAEFSDLQSYRVGARIGLVAIEEALKGIDITYVENISQLFLMLSSGRLDVVVVPRDVGASIAYSMANMPVYQDIGLDLQSIKPLSPALDRGEIYHYLHSKNIDLVAPLTEILERMGADGSIEILREKNNLKYYGHK